MFIIGMIFTCASAIVSVSTALNAISVHGACTAVFIAVSAVVGFLLASIRTLGDIQWLGWAGLVSIAGSVLTLVVAVGVQDRPAAAPQSGPWDKDITLFAHPDFATAMTMVAGVMFAYGATPTYFGVISEMRDPSKYRRAMYASMGLTTVVYLVLGSVVYHFCGQYVSSPALGSAGVLMKKVCYGLSLPGLLASLCIFSHVSGASASATTDAPGHIQVHLRPPPPRHGAPLKRHTASLDNVARLHVWRDGSGVHPRLCDSVFRSHRQLYRRLLLAAGRAVNLPRHVVAR